MSTRVPVAGGREQKHNGGHTDTTTYLYKPHSSLQEVRTHPVATLAVSHTACSSAALAAAPSRTMTVNSA